MNGLNLSNITDAKIGGTQVSALYYGSTKIWELIQNRINYEKQYFTIEALENDTRIDLGAYGTSTYTTPQFTIQYSLDGATWTSYTLTSRTKYSASSLTTLNKGQKIMFKSTNTKWGRNVNSEWGQMCYYLGAGSGSIKIYGNINSLIKGDNFYKNYNLLDTESGSAFNYLFSSSTARLIRIKDVSNLYLPDYIIGASNTSTGENCSIYGNLFANCTSITTAPIMDIYQIKNNNGQNKYSGMFSGCTNLTDLSNITIFTYNKPASKFFNSTFSGCTSLVNAPLILAINGATTYSYLYTFGGCTNLTYLEYSNKETPVNTWFGTNSNNCWTTNTPKLSTVYVNNKSNLEYYKNNKTFSTSKYYNPSYFTIESLDDDNTITLNVGSYVGTHQLIVYINGEALSTVKQVNSNTSITLGTLNKGDVIQLKDRNADSYALGRADSYSYFSSTGRFNISGNLTSINGTGTIGSNEYIAGYQWKGLFYDSKVVDASRLIINNIKQLTGSSVYALSYMFKDCTLLERAPKYIKLNNTTGFICTGMFQGCTSLYEGPDIYFNTDVTGSTNACSDMFNGCEKLEYVGIRGTSGSLSSAGSSSWLKNTNPNILTVNTNIWDSTSNFSKVPEGATIINNKFDIED